MPDCYANCFISSLLRGIAIVLPIHPRTSLLWISLTILSVNPCSSQQADAKHSLESVLGKWSKSHLSVDGIRVTHTLELKRDENEENFEHVWSIHGEDESRDSLWEAKLKIEPLGEKLFALKYIENRRLAPADKTHDWQPFGLTLVVQAEEKHLYASNSLDRETWIWQREGVESNVTSGSRLEILSPMLESYSGTHDHVGSEAYGVSNTKSHITSTGKLTPTGTVLEHSWVSIPEGAGSDQAFEAKGIYSYSVKDKTIIKQYQTSTGIHMTGRLVSSQGKKMLWERVGEGPSGTVRELCQFDFSEPGIFKHTIIRRSLNGVPTEESGQVIILKQ